MNTDPEFPHIVAHAYYSLSLHTDFIFRVLMHQGFEKHKALIARKQLNIERDQGATYVVSLRGKKLYECAYHWVDHSIQGIKYRLHED